MVYFIAAIHTEEQERKEQYREYIRLVKPIVEHYGGRYLLRSEKVTPLTGRWMPDRIILIQWDSREALDRCFSSQEYLVIAEKRESSVDSRAVIVEE